MGRPGRDDHPPALQRPGVGATAERSVHRRDRCPDPPLDPQVAIDGADDRPLVGGVIVGAYPGADLEVLMLAFVVIIIGGMGSLKGAFFGGLVVGLLDTWGKTFFPELAMFTIFVPMVVILAIWPTGLFGRA